MKKEYHLTITRKDRIYLVIFVTFLLGWELMKWIIPSPKIVIHEKLPITPDTSYITEHEPDWPRQEYVYKKTSYKKFEEGEPDIEEIKHEPYRVEIMNASLQELILIGFSKKVAYNIEKYKSVGGVIYNEKSLKKIYGIDTNQLGAILPFIIFPKKEFDDKKEFNFSRKMEAQELNAEVFDLNQVTKEELESLPGIGAVLADRILKFRSSLGGYTSVSQITECYGLVPETFEKIKSRLIIVQPAQKFDINSLDPKTFVHPYIEKKILYMLPNYIKNHGLIENEEDLRKVFPPDPGWCDRVLPYIIFPDG